MNNGGNYARGTGRSSTGGENDDRRSSRAEPASLLGRRSRHVIQSANKLTESALERRSFRNSRGPNTLTKSAFRRSTAPNLG
jgi:hypothetical protein